MFDIADVTSLATRPHSYVFVLFNQMKRVKTVGRLGRLEFRPGFYLYVGSARKNVLKRVKRHMRATKRIHWHIDYLTTGSGRMKPVDAYIFHGEFECEIAQFLSRMLATIRGFGSSDCRCKGHLFYAGRMPVLKLVVDKLILRFGTAKAGTLSNSRGCPGSAPGFVSGALSR